MTLFLNKNERFFSSYNKILIFLFISLFFIDNVTRYKHFLFFIMIATSAFYFFSDPKIILEKLKTKLFSLTIIFSVIIFVTLVYSVYPEGSFKSINNSFLNYGVLSLAILFPIILYKENKESISNLLILSFFSSLFVVLLCELIKYYIAYHKGILPFTTYKFRNVSDALVFLYPSIIAIWYVFPKVRKSYFYLFVLIFLFVLIGTLSRGAWIAVASSTIVFLLFKRPWKLIFTLIALLVFGLISLKTFQPDMSKKLFFKLEQTDSSYRYKNGTQGTAFELIMEKPILGYGFGKDTYNHVYNNAVSKNPQWIFKRSIGPHNIWLTIWFSAGILGFLSFILLFLSICYCSFKEIMNSDKNKKLYFAGIVLLASSIGFYLVRGMFEQVDLKPLGILIGFLCAIVSASEKDNGYENE